MTDLDPLNMDPQSIFAEKYGLVSGTNFTEKYGPP